MTNTLTTTQPKRKLPRRWIWVAAATAVVLVAAGAIPVGLRLEHDRTIMLELQGSEDALSAAAASYDQSSVDLTKAYKEAIADAADVEKLLIAVPADLVDPATALDDAKKQLEDLQKLAEKKNAKAPEILADTALMEDESSEARVAATAENQIRTAAITASQDQVDARISDINDAREAVAKSIDALAAAAATKGATLAYTLAPEADRAALTTAIAALKLKATSLTKAIGGVQTYVTAATTAAASHAAAAAAAVAQPGTPAPDGGAWAPDGSWIEGGQTWSPGEGGQTWNPGGGGGGQPTNPGGGGGQPTNPGGGGGEPPAPECWGNQENACDKTAPTFATDGNYVGYDGSCIYYSSHNVGYGGHSMGGVPGAERWSATVSGPTVDYYVC